jgi:UDP-3-O-[3-hydroxymyristoyl] glucosamine N-acyltransferase
MTETSATEITLGQLAEHLGGALTGDPERVVRGANGLADAGEDDITFLANVRYERYMAGAKAAAVIVADDYEGPGESLIRCPDPYFAFRQAMVLLYGFREHPYRGVDEAARIDPTAELGEGVTAAQFATVGAEARIGPRTVLYPGVYVGAGCRIGADCVLYPNVVVYERCLLGDRVTIHANSVIGQDGFGYATHEGVHEKIPPAGWVEIGDDVEIGACCAVDRATVGATVIGAGTKFSNLVTIGHGTQVGAGCLFVAQAGIAGSVKIGHHCAFGGQAGVIGHLEIGDGARVGAQSGVIKDVPAGKEVQGTPAMPRKQAWRAFAVQPHLARMRNEINKLSAELAELKGREKPEKPK